MKDTKDTDPGPTWRQRAMATMGRACDAVEASEDGVRLAVLVVVKEGSQGVMAISYDRDDGSRRAALDALAMKLAGDDG